MADLRSYAKRAAPLAALPAGRLYSGWALIGRIVDALALDVIDRILHGDDVLRFLVRDLDRVVGRAELLFHRHDQLDQVEGVRVEVVYERRRGHDLLLLDAELLDDDLAYAFEDGWHRDHLPL